MKKIVIILLIALFLFVANVYYKHYSIFKNSEIRLSGFKFTDSENKLSIKERLGLSIFIKNNTNKSGLISKIKIALINSNGVEIGKIQDINNIEIPKNGSFEIDFFVNSLNVIELANDIATGKIRGYKYKVTVVFLGFLPFTYTDYILTQK